MMHRIVIVLGVSLFACQEPAYVPPAESLDLGTGDLLEAPDSLESSSGGVGSPSETEAPQTREESCEEQTEAFCYSFADPEQLAECQAFYTLLCMERRDTGPINPEAHEACLDEIYAHEANPWWFPAGSREDGLYWRGGAFANEACNCFWGHRGHHEVCTSREYK